MLIKHLPHHSLLKLSCLLDDALQLLQWLISCVWKHHIVIHILLVTWVISAWFEGLMISVWHSKMVMIHRALCLPIKFLMVHVILLVILNFLSVISSLSFFTFELLLMHVIMINWTISLFVVFLLFLLLVIIGLFCFLLILSIILD